LSSFLVAGTDFLKNEKELYGLDKEKYFLHGIKKKG
jgi:hypothetical protein